MYVTLQEANVSQAAILFAASNKKLVFIFVPDNNILREQENICVSRCAFFRMIQKKISVTLFGLMKQRG